MLVLKPAPLAKIWGDKALLDYGCDDIDGMIGEACTVCADPKCSSLIVSLTPPITLAEYYRMHADQFGWTGPFPLTITIVSAREDLSLQVHPDREKAKELEGLEDGKEESWVFLRAGAQIVAGTKCRKEEIPMLIAENRWEEIYARMAIEDHDYVHVRPGTLHAISAGSLVYEIMQSNDVTYRFYDYDRTDSQGNKRQLHLSKALACLNTELAAEKTRFEEGRVYEAERYRISSRRIEGKTEIENPEEVFACITVLEGSFLWNGISVFKGYSVILFPKEKAGISGRAVLMTAYAKP